MNNKKLTIGLFLFCIFFIANVIFATAQYPNTDATNLPPFTISTQLNIDWYNRIQDEIIAMQEAVASGITFETVGIEDGSEGSPSLYFNDDTDNGLYRIGANNWALVAGGSVEVDISSSGATFEGTLSSVGNFAVNTNKFTVAASTGNTAVAGTLTVNDDTTISKNQNATTAINISNATSGTAARAGVILEGQNSNYQTYMLNCDTAYTSVAYWQNYAVFGCSTGNAGLLFDCRVATGDITFTSLGNDIMVMDAAAQNINMPNGSLTLSDASTPQLILKSGGTNVGPAFLQFQDTASTPLAYVGFGGANDDLILNNQISGNTTFYNGGSISVDIDSSQNVSIPNGALAVRNGVLNIGEESYSSGYVNTENSMYFNVNSDGGVELSFFKWATDRSEASGGTELMELTEDGNLIITGDLTVTGNDIKDGGGSAAITFDGSSNVSIPNGNTTITTGYLNMGNLAAEPATPTNSAIMFAEGGEMIVKDASGNTTEISPHGDDDGEWHFISGNVYTGRAVDINMEAFIKDYDNRFGTDFHKESWVKPKKWDNEEKEKPTWVNSVRARNPHYRANDVLEFPVNRVKVKSKVVIDEAIENYNLELNN